MQRSRLIWIASGMLVVAGLFVLVLQWNGMVSRQEGGEAGKKVGSPPELNDEAILVSRIESRWKVLIARDFRAAFEFELPSYRERTPFERFRGGFGGAVKWHVARVTELRYDGPTVARVKVEVEYESSTSWSEQPVRSTAYISETWLKRDGQWWHSQAG